MEYEECIACDDYFFDDMECIFDDDVEDEIDEREDDYVDYDVFVYDETNLRKEIANLLIPDVNEKPSSTSSRINHIANMYMQTTSKGETFARYIKPVVVMRKYIFPTDADDKFQLLYDVDNYEKETTDKFIERHENASAHVAFRPFVPQNTNKTVAQDIDATYIWSNGENKIIEEKRVLQKEDIQVIGLANVYNANVFKNRVSDFPIMSVDEYIRELRLLRPDAQVRVIPHDSVGGLEPADARVVSNDSSAVVLEVLDGDGGVQYTIGIENAAQVLAAPFCIGIKGKQLFNKYEFIRGGCIATVLDSDALALLYPTASEWLYCNTHDRDIIYNIRDIETVFVDDVTGKCNVAKDIIAKNIAKASVAMRNRKSVKIVRKVHRPKTWPKLLEVDNFPGVRSSQDTAVGRMAFLRHALQKQVLECIRIEVDAKRDTVALPNKTTIEPKMKPYEDKIKSALVGKKRFDTFSQAFAMTPSSDTDTAFVWYVVPDEEIAKAKKKGVPLPTTIPVFAALNVFSHDGIRVWTADIALTRKTLKDIDADLDIDPLRYTLRLKNMDVLYSDHDAHTSYRKQSDLEVRRLKLEKDIQKLRVVVNHDFLQYMDSFEVDIRDAIGIEGDDDFIDFEQEYNNAEFGVQYNKLDNNAYEDELDDEVPEFANAAIENAEITYDPTFFGIVSRFMTVIGVHLDHDTLRYITDYVNTECNYDKTMDTLAKAEKAKIAELRTKFKDLDVFEEKKKLLLSKLGAIKKQESDKVFGKAIYVIAAMACIWVQSSLPRAVIVPIPEHAKLFSFEGYPMNAIKGNNLIGYIATVLKEVASNMTELTSVLSKEPVKGIELNITDAVQDILAKVITLRHKIEVASQAYAEFIKTQKSALEILREYPVWSTFRPFFDTKGLDFDGTNIEEASASYIALVQRVVERATRLKIGADKVPLQVNSCCIQPLAASLNYWNYFYDKDTVVDFLTKHHNVLNANDITTHHSRVWRLVSRQGESSYFERVDVKYDANNIRIMDAVKEAGDVPMTNAYIITKNIREFIENNEVFKEDVLIQSVIELGNDRATWNKLSVEAYKILDDMQRASSDLNLDSLRNMFTISGDTPVALLTKTIYEFMAFDMKSILGKIAHIFKFNNTWAKGRNFQRDVKMSIDAAYKKFVDPKIIELFTRASFEELQERMSSVVQSGLVGIKHLESMLTLRPERVSDISIAYLMLYVFARVINEFYIEEHTRGFVVVVNFLIETLKNKYDKNVAIINASQVYETQREDYKQSIMKTMKNMNSGDRDLIQQLKERGLVDNMDIANGVLNIGGHAEEDFMPQYNEADHEIGAEILNNHGEDGDYDD